MDWRAGWKAPPQLSLLTTLLVFYNSSMEACYQKPEGKKQQKKTRETDSEKERRRQGGKEEGEMGDCGIDSLSFYVTLFSIHLFILPKCLGD